MKNYKIKKREKHPKPGTLKVALRPSGVLLVAVPLICVPNHNKVPRISRMALHVEAPRYDIPFSRFFDLGLGFRFSCRDLSC